MKRFLMLAILSLWNVPQIWAWDASGVDWQKAASGGTKLFKAAAGMSDADEIKLGREVAANLAARYGFVEDPAQLHYLNLVGQAVVRHCKRREITYHFGILKSAEFNAFAAPGGYIFVTQGLLSLVKDESELAGVLAHEISHVTERHIVKAIREANLVGAGKDLAAAVQDDPGTMTMLSDFSINLLDKGFSRKDELAADRFGTELAGQVGYDPNGLAGVVERLGELQGKDPALAHFTNTHPAAADRLKEIRKILPKHEDPAAIRLAERYAKNFPLTK